MEVIFTSQFERVIPILGKENFNKLQKANIIIFGIGGVGSYVAEALVRTGIGNITIVDGDKIEESNINRQLPALYSTVGKSKVEVMKSRVLDINPNINIVTYNVFVTSENIDMFNFSFFFYVIDAIDTVSAKLKIIQKAKECDIRIISSMGTGNKMDVTKFKICDISKTSVCPLAKIIRKELSKLGIKNVKVLFSTEEPLVKSRDSISSLAFVPGTAGLMIASEVIKDIAFA